MCWCLTLFYVFDHLPFYTIFAGTVRHSVQTSSNNSRQNCKNWGICLCLFHWQSLVCEWFLSPLNLNSRFWYPFIMIHYTSMHNKLNTNLKKHTFLSSKMHTALCETITKSKWSGRIGNANWSKPDFQWVWSLTFLSLWLSSWKILTFWATNEVGFILTLFLVEWNEQIIETTYIKCYKIYFGGILTLY